jgi:CubicO group peptidase (beta-lactamase class C family)
MFQSKTIDLAAARDRIVTWLSGYIDSGRLPCASVLIRQGQAEMPLITVGRPDVTRPVLLGDDHIFQIHSMIKPMAAALCMRLIDAGKLRLMDPVANYLPEFAEMRVLKSPETHETVPAERAITIRDLLAHTAGLGHLLFDEGPLRDLYRAQGIPETDGGADLGETVRAIASLPLLYQPYTRWHYSCSYVVFGHLVETITGQTFEEALRHYVLDPLGLSPDTAFVLPPARLPLRMPIHRLNDAGQLQPNPAEDKLRPGMRPSAHAGLNAPIRDFMAFAHMLALNGDTPNGRFLPRTSVDTILSNHLPGTMETVGPTVYRGKSYAGHGYGLGMAVLLDPARSQSPANAGEAGCGSEASSFFWVDQAVELSVVLMTALAPSSLLPIRRELRQIVYGSA